MLTNDFESVNGGPEQRERYAAQQPDHASARIDSKSSGGYRIWHRVVKFNPLESDSTFIEDLFRVYERPLRKWETEEDELVDCDGLIKFPQGVTIF